MPNLKSAKKRLRQDERRNLTNRIKKSQLRTWFRKLREAAAAGNKDEARTLLPLVCQKIDKAAKGNCIHANAASRKKRQAQKLVADLG